MNGTNGDHTNGMKSNDSFILRLERALDIQEKEYQKTRDDVTGLKNQQTVIQRDLSTITQTIQGLAVKMDDRSRPNWPALAIGVTMFIAVVPLMGFVMTTYTNNAVAPVVTATTLNGEALKNNRESIRLLETASSAGQAADVNSRSDREQLNLRVRSLEGAVSNEIADRRTNAAGVKVSLAEIESQFHALSNVENLRAAQQERLNSILYEAALPGKRYPNGTFFPTTMFQNGSASGGPSVAGSVP